MLLMVADAGILMSIISNVSAIAKTPSQKASKRELGFVSAIDYTLSVSKWFCVTSLAYFRNLEIEEEGATTYLSPISAH